MAADDDPRRAVGAGLAAGAWPADLHGEIDGDADVPDRKVAVVDDTVTGARRLGLGKELVLATERKAAELGFDRMYIKVDRQNFDARRVYDRLGFRVVYLQPLTDPRKGPTGANLFLRKDGLLSASS